MAKDKKAKAAEKKVRVAQKNEKKATQKEKKSRSKPASGNEDGQDADDGADLDAILADYAKKQEQFHKVTETTSSPPPPRSAGTFIANPADSREVLLFGGEHYNGAIATFSNDLYIYRVPTDQWRKVTSPNSPLPRSGHAVCRGDNAGGLYLFGGEFSSPKQGTFYHYGDFWHLDPDPSSREWTKLEPPTRSSPTPSARSGHRMVGFKRYIVLFGGFQDTSQQTRYLNDLWIYDCQTFVWHQPVLPPAAGRPEPRSSFSFLPHETGAVLVGGYSRVKASTITAKSKGGRQATRVVMKPVVHTDAWFLRITSPGPEAAANALPTVRWERRKKPANLPSPVRAGATMSAHKGRGIMFGGVHDVEEDEEGIESEFFNQLWAYNIDRNRFFQLSLRKPRGPPKKQTPAMERSKRGRGKADEEELLRNLALLEGKGTLAGSDDEDMTTSALAKHNASAETHYDDDQDAKIEKPVSYEPPHPRFNAHLAVQDDVLYIQGGTLEKGDREFTFDEMFAVDLGKLDGCREMYHRELEDWLGSEDEDSDDEEEEDEDEDDEEGEDGNDDAQDRSSANDQDSQVATSTPATSIADPNDDRQEDTQGPPKQDDDPLPHPRPFESLRQFFTRTSNIFQDAILSSRQFGASANTAGIRGDMSEDSSVKEFRKKAFAMAEAKWWDCREEVQALEEEQEEAGIGEVVSLDARGGGADSGGGSGNAVKRR